MHISTAPTEEALQLMLPFREVEMRQAVQRTFRRNRRAGATPPKEAMLDWLMVEQLDLDLPLFDVAGTVFDSNWEVVPSDKPTETDFEPGLACAQRAACELDLACVPDNFDDLCMELVASLHGKLLYRQLEQLFYARDINGKARREVLQWIFAPHEFSHTCSDGTQKTVRAVFVPFTFDACCSFEEIDAIALRYAISRRIQELGASRTLLARPQTTELQ